MTIRHRAAPTGRPPAWALARAGMAVTVALGLLAAARLGRKLVAVTVRGISMEPTYRDGDLVLVRRGAVPRPGQVVVTEPPAFRAGQPSKPLSSTARAADVAGRDWLIKRVAAVAGDPVPRDRVPALALVAEELVPPGMLVLLGDNQEVSFDSRLVGYFPAELVLGTVIYPLSRRHGVARIYG